MLRPCALALVAVLLLAPPASAATGDRGHDLAGPQCGTTYPSGGSFGTVSVTDGKPFNENPCLADEGAWAAGLASAHLYVNTANPGPTSSHWPTADRICRDPASTTDSGCAYEYGRAAAADALARATATLQGVLDPRTVTWWLDVEGNREPGHPGNTWQADATADAADLAGFVDALREGGVPRVGVYSSADQWQNLTGGYAAGTAASYRARWAFTPTHRLEDGPVWFAGAGTAASASARCLAPSLTGGQRQLAQYAAGTATVPVDGDVRCDTTPPRAAVVGPGPVTVSTTLHPAWSGSDDVAVASFDVQWSRATPASGLGTWQPLLTHTTSRSTSQARAPLGSTTCYRVRSRDAADSVSPWSAARCTSVPLDDRALTAGRGWTRSSASGYLAATRTSSSTAGAALTSGKIATHRLVLLATRCPTCGRVRAYVGSRLLVTVDLHASTTVRSALIALPASSAGTATVRLSVVASGRPVVVDGLVSSRV